MSDDPAQTIVDFARSLPISIATSILFFVVTYAGGSNFNEMDDAYTADSVDAYFRDRRGLSRFGAALRLRVAFDFVLFRDSFITECNRTAMPQMQAKFERDGKERLAQTMARTVATGEFNRPYVIQALERWAALREGALADAAFLDFETAILSG